MANSDETILFNSISRNGMHRLHVMRVGAPVDELRWLTAVPDQSKGLEGKFAWMDGKAIIRYHLMIWWPCRFEPVDAGEKGKVILTKLMPGDQIREVIREAALTLWAATDHWAEQAVMPTWPKDAPEQVATDFGMVRLVTADWALSRCVVVL